jgi:hypothetical protein
VQLLRIKCEAYATLNDQDENTDAERALHARMAGLNPPAAQLVAPAALYLTAILECVCECAVVPAPLAAARSHRPQAHPAARRPRRRAR